MRFYTGLVNRAAAAVLAMGMAYGTAVMADTAPAGNAPDADRPVATQVDSGQTDAGQVDAGQAAAAPVQTLSTGAIGAKTTFSVHADPYFPPAVIAAFALLYAAGCMVAAKRGVRGAWLRATAGVAITAALINPEIDLENRQPSSTIVDVVVDKSASQSLDGRDAATSTVYNSVMAQLSKIPGLDVRTVDAGEARGGRQPDGSNLFGAADGALLGVPPDRLGAVIMLTDGQVHDVPKQYSQKDSGAPLHVLLSGRDGEKDRRIVADSTPLYGVVGNDLTIKFHVVDNGVPANEQQQAQVTVKADGVDVATQTVTPGQPAEVTIKVPHGGDNVIELTAAPLPGELTPLNNSFVASVRGVRDHLRVLLISGEPNADERTWREMLKSDPSTDLVHFTILRPPDKQDRTPPEELALIAFPTRQLFSEKLPEFDLVILDHYQNRAILPEAYFDNIVEYVRNGGALMVGTGPEYAGTDSLFKKPLSDILPAEPTGTVTEQPFYPHITAQGQRHPVTRGLEGPSPLPPGATPPWGQWTRLVDTNKTAGDTVMDGGPNNEPLLVLNREGKGRVAMLMSDSAWLWARGIGGGGPYADLLQRTTHWLMQETDLEEEALHLTAQGGVLTVEEQTMADAASPVTVHTPSGKTETVELKNVSPGLWRATVPADDIGLYSAEGGDKKAFANIGTATPKEYADTISTASILKPVVDETGGGIIRMTPPGGDTAAPSIRAVKNGGAGAGGDWLGIRMTDAYALQSSQRLSLMSGWLGFTILIGALGAAWYRDGDGAWFRRENWGRKSAAPQNKGPSP